ncbi:MAG: response regulator [Phycisphaerales bacterium]
MTPRDRETARPVEILLVEDNPGDVRLTREALLDAKVVNNLNVVSDGEKAIQFLLQENGYGGAPVPDLILLDLNLPRKGGREVLEEIKSHEQLRAIPIVVLTTSTNDEDVLSAYQLHANCYITKPVDFDQFLRVIRQLENFWLSVVHLPPRD